MSIVPIFSQKESIIYATRAIVNLGVLVFKISVLRQKLVIFCATRAGAILGELVFKINILRQKLVTIVSSCLHVNLISRYFTSLSCARTSLGVLASKIRILLQKLVIFCATRARENLGVLPHKRQLSRNVGPTSHHCNLSPTFAITNTSTVKHEFILQDFK